MKFNPMIFLSSLFLLISTHFRPSSSLLNPYISEELTSCGSCFDEQIQSWYASNLVDSTKIAYDCNGACLLGGLNILGPSALSTAGQYFQRIYKDLPPHSAVYISLTMYEIDSQELNDYVQITLDSQSFTTYPRLFYNVNLPSVCGQTYYVDVPNDRLFIKIPHSAGSLTLKFIMRNNQPSTDESWGFKDIRVHFVSTSATISPTMCMISPARATMAYACPCDEGYYDASGTCLQCDPACSSCFGATADTCYQCSSGYGFDGTQCIKCDASCSTCRGPTANECNSCPSGKALLNGESCQDASVCVSPFPAQTDTCSGSYCANTCYPSKYIMPDGSCRATCEAPLIIWALKKNP